MTKYIITFANGFKQICNLISDDEYLQIKYLQKRLNNIDEMLSIIGKKNKLYKETLKEKQITEDSIKSFGNWFVEKSPLGKAIFEGTNIIILPKHQGGAHKITWKCG